MKLFLILIAILIAVGMAAGSIYFFIILAEFYAEERRLKKDSEETDLTTRQ